MVFGLEVCPRCAVLALRFLAAQPWYPGPCTGRCDETRGKLRGYLVAKAVAA